MFFFTICRCLGRKSSLKVPRQLLRTMKLTALFLVAICLHVSATGFGQKVTISGKDIPLEKVFSVIKKQTDYVCFYGYDIMKDAKKVTLNFNNAEIEEVLQAALWEQGLDFSITGKTITIVKKLVAPVTGPGKTIRAAGTVYSETGQPLAGANVTIRNNDGVTAFTLIKLKMPHVIHNIKDSLDCAISIRQNEPADFDCLLYLDFR